MRNTKPDFRKTIGANDPSSDFTDILTFGLNTISIKLKCEYGKYYLAVIQNGAYFYSIKSSILRLKEIFIQVLETLV